MDSVKSHVAHYLHAFILSVLIDMKISSEIKVATEALPAKQKQEQLLFLADRLRAEGVALRSVRAIPKEQVTAWIAEDEADAKQLRESE